MEAGYFSSTSEKVKACVFIPVALTGDVQYAAEADLIAAGTLLMVL